MKQKLSSYTQNRIIIYPVTYIYTHIYKEYNVKY